MDIERLQEGNKLLKEINDHKAKIVKLTSSIYVTRENIARIKRFAKLFRRSDNGIKRYDKEEGVWYWTYSVEPERMVELTAEDMEVMLEGYHRRIAELEEQFEEL